MAIGKSQSIRTKVSVVAGILIAVIALSSVRISASIDTAAGDLREVAGSVDSVINRLIPLTEVIGRIRLDVVQVQQFLSDISATRGQDGLADGLDKAAEFARQFAEDTAQARKIAGQMGLTQVVAALEEVQRSFGPYYETGQRMAKTYIDQGPPGGNAMMPDFDKVAEQMSDHLTKLIEGVAVTSQSQFATLTQSIKTIEDTHDRIRLVGILSGLIMVGVACASIALLVLGVTRPLHRLQALMVELAGGRYDLEVSYRDRGDEIGEMAKAVQVFKESGQENERLKRAGEAEQEAKRKRQVETEELIDMFGSSVSGVFHSLSQASHTMAVTAGSMTDVASETNSQVGIVTTEVGHASENAQSVASASHELTAAIGEISRLIVTSTEVAGHCADQAQTAVDRVDALRAASDRIGNVVNIIAGIATQTNLLALNATIEAARAGDAGKGFAVVAGEVKSLSGQTQKATVEIGGLINEVQSLIGGATDAVSAIGGTIGRIHEATNEIAAAVTEQQSATEEIARNVQFLSNCTDKISLSIDNVRSAADQTLNASDGVRRASDTMAAQAEKLSSEVKDFLAAIRGAGTRHDFDRLDIDLAAEVRLEAETRAVRLRQISLGGAWMVGRLAGELGSSVELSINGISHRLSARIAGTSGDATRLQFPLNDTHLELMARVLAQVGRSARAV
jgi:methyl-accepting chemotaxis protein